MSSSGHASQLAVNGGPKVRTQPWPGRGLFGEEEKAAAVALFDEAIRTGDVFAYNGPEEEAYCHEFAEYMGGGYADAVNSGSSALYVALRSLRIEPFTEVICPSITDPGGIMPVALLNCIPIVADTHPGSYNVGPDQVAECLSERTSAIVVAHICGEPADMDPILEIARSRGIPVVEDCAQAHGARYKGRICGTLGDVAAFSTMSGKHHATAAQGGVVFTKSEETYWEARRASDRGKPFGLAGEGSNVTASLNLNLNDLSAAIGRVQVKKIDAIAAGRRKFVAMVHEGLKRCKAVSAGWEPEGAESSYWFLRLHVDTSKVTVDGDTFASAVAAEGLPIGASYRGALQAHAKWLVERRAFGTSRYPWCAPEYKGDPDRQFPCPNAVAVTDSDCNLYVHERCGEQEAIDTVEAILKVERAYLR